MHVSNSHPKPPAMAPTPVAEPPPSDTPEPPVGATLARGDCLARSGQSAQYFVEPTRLSPGTGSVDEAEVRLILEMRHQEFMARQALEELFESGAAEFLSI
jgi:hypothetical protein